MHMRSKPRATTSMTARPYSTRTTTLTASTRRPMMRFTPTPLSGPTRSSSSPSMAKRARRGTSATSHQAVGRKRPCTSRSVSGPRARTATGARSCGPAAIQTGARARSRRTSSPSSSKTTWAGATKPSETSSISTMSERGGGRMSESKAAKREKDQHSSSPLARKLAQLRLKSPEAPRLPRRETGLLPRALRKWATRVRMTVQWC